MAESTIILDTTAIGRALARIAHEIAERNEVSADVVLVGIPAGGDVLAQRLGKILSEIWKHPVPVGSLDVSMHRDDLDRRVAQSCPKNIAADAAESIDTDFDWHSSSEVFACLQPGTAGFARVTLNKRC